MLFSYNAALNDCMASSPLALVEPAEGECSAPFPFSISLDLGELSGSKGESGRGLSFSDEELVVLRDGDTAPFLVAVVKGDLSFSRTL